jgi:hypothetical protein
MRVGIGQNEFSKWIIKLGKDDLNSEVNLNIHQKKLLFNLISVLLVWERHKNYNYT